MMPGKWLEGMSGPSISTYVTNEAAVKILCRALKEEAAPRGILKGGGRVVTSTSETFTPVIDQTTCVLTSCRVGPRLSWQLRVMVGPSSPSPTKTSSMVKRHRAVHGEGIGTISLDS